METKLITEDIPEQLRDNFEEGIEKENQIDFKPILMLVNVKEPQIWLISQIDNNGIPI